MITIDPYAGETLADYQSRCVREAARAQRAVFACYEGVIFFVRGTMSEGELANEWIEAKSRTKREVP